MTKVSKRKTVKKSSTKKKVVKKTVKKPIKKTTVKKKLPKKSERPLIAKNAHPDKVFVLVNGQRLKNVKELADVMGKIEDFVFEHHVTEDRNDFANWLRDVFKDIDLAKEVSGCKNKENIQLVLYRHISHKLW